MRHRTPSAAEERSGPAARKYYVTPISRPCRTFSAAVESESLGHATMVRFRLVAFSPSSSATVKLPMSPASVTAKERKIISSFVRERRGSQDGERWIVTLRKTWSLKKGRIGISEGVLIMRCPRASGDGASPKRGGGYDHVCGPPHNRH